MIRLEDGGGRPRILLFGAGLIGAAVAEACERWGGLSGRRLPLPWHDRAGRLRRLAALEEEVIRDLAADAPAPAVLWSAGAAGFGAGEAEAEAELEAFRDLLAASERLSHRWTDRRRTAPAGDRLVFHLVSSAGGLFEGRRLVGPRTEPRPLRPYGRLKLAQEEALAASPAPLEARVYRLSSVYGPVAGGRRRGLIPTLLADGLRRRTSTVTGRPDTLRDFVWVEDVGRFVARELLRTGRGPVPATTTLAAGRPASLHEVRRLIESALGRRLHVTYAPQEAGTADITFSPEALPPGWQSTDLRVGIRRVRDRLLGRGMSHRPLERAG